jgi:hypothetical protein
MFPGVQFKRVEAMARSHTIMDLKSPHPGTPTLGEQMEQYPVKSAKDTRWDQ